jgi:tRNA-splicing endonuclease subunit Sen34
MLFEHLNSGVYADYADMYQIRTLELILRSSIGVEIEAIMAAQVETPAPDLPFPIFRISASVERYMLYDINTITWLRRTHHILGVTVGTLPHVPQQNVFLGLPLELMPEEARLLFDKNVAYIVNDDLWHENAMQHSHAAQRRTYLDGLADQGDDAAKAAEREKMARSEQALRRLRLDKVQVETPEDHDTATESHIDASDSLFTPGPPPMESKRGQLRHNADSWAVTPSTASDMMSAPTDHVQACKPMVKNSYAVFKQLHDNGYYMSPGLRFGCQFMAYPGDPLRYHSHFLAIGAAWDEEFDLLDLVAGGRLGTGVKKGFLIGGNEAGPSGETDHTRTFCIEWGGM